MQLTVGDQVVSAAWLTPAQPVAQLVFAHGAGAGYTHATMQALAEAFAEQNLATLRFNFPYMEQGKRRVDRQDVAVAAIQAAYSAAKNTHNLPTFLAGHSFGGRMASHAVVERNLNCDGLVFCSFPLHPPKKPATQRAQHLQDVTQPMLFLSGTRDDLADPTLLAGVVEDLPNAQLHWLETANHSYVTLKRTRQNPLPVFEEMALKAGEFVAQLIA